MSTVAGEGMAEGGTRQVELTVRQAAKVAGVSTKQVRRWIVEKRVRAVMREGKHGPTWYVEATSLPPGRAPLDAAERGDRQGGQGLGDGRGEGSDGVASSLLALVREKDGQLETRRRELEAASGRIGYLEAEAARVKLLEARAENLATREQEARTEGEGQRQRAEGLASDVGDLRGALRLRTWTAALLLVGFLVAVATILLR